MLFIGVLALIALGGVTVWFAGHVYREVKASGAFASTPKGIRGAGQRARTTARAARPAAGKAVRQAPGKARQAPAKVSHIIAGAVAQDWVAKRAHIRANGKPAKPPREPLMARLVFPGKRIPATAPANGKPAAAQQPVTVAPAQPARPATEATPVPAPAAPGRTSPAMPTTTTTSGAGAASDLFAAVNTVTGHARAGGMRSKGRAFSAFHEGFGQMAGGLEQFARDLQENGQYGPEVWETAIQAAAHLRAAAAQMGEGSSALTALARTPMGEVATSSVNAPRREEINTA